MPRKFAVMNWSLNRFASELLLERFQGCFPDGSLVDKEGVSQENELT